MLRFPAFPHKQSPGKTVLTYAMEQKESLATFSVCTCDAAFVSTRLMYWLSRALYEKRVHLFQAQSDSAYNL